MENFLTPQEYNLEDIFKGKYSIPIYQRPYSWGKEQIKVLLEDIQKNYIVYYSDKTEIKDEEFILFTGTIFIKSTGTTRNRYNNYEIVDGQQRITTFTLILMKILDYYYSLGEEYSDITNEIKLLLWKKEMRDIGKNLRVLTLGNIDRNIMIDLFDELYNEKNLIDFVELKLRDNINEIEKNLLLNYKYISEYFERNFNSQEQYYKYLLYIKSNIRFISIMVNTNLVKLFDIFESINSKGKPLEEIDLIKSYIFQNILEEDYLEYLEKWGKLIKETNDNLMDYLIIYIRANICYYRNSIKLNNFKKIVNSDFKEYFQSERIRETLKLFIDDLINKVRYYKYINNASLLEKSLSYKGLSYLMMSKKMEYIYTKALFFKLLILKENNNLEETVLEDILASAFTFIYSFQSICAKESKKTLEIFMEIQKIFYESLKTYNSDFDCKNFNHEKISKYLYKMIVDNNITDTLLKNNLKTNITYSKNKKAVKLLLSNLEYFNKNGGLEFDKIYWILKIGKDIHIDHIIPKNPKKTDENFKFYLLNDKVVLKEGQDFFQDINVDVTREEFEEKFLDVIGNLKLEWANDNKKKSNNLISLRGFDKNFNSSSKISSRTISLLKTAIESKILMSKSNILFYENEIEKNDIFEISSYEKNIEFKNCVPVSYKILGEKYILSKNNYTKLLIEILIVLEGLDPEKIEYLANSLYKPMQSSRIYLSKDLKDLREAVEINKNIYQEINLSSNYIIKYLYILINNLGLKNDDLIISLKTKI